MKRLILTYNQNCNLSCDFCYINFHYEKIEDKTYEIIKRAISLNFDIITFGGGDAFSKKSFRDSCILAKENNLVTHVDTNGLSIKSNDFDFIKKYVDVIGISLDGIGEYHDDLRKSKNLFSKINSIIEHMESLNIKMKINTILTEKNKDSIYNLYIYLTKFKNIERWSIYQFFPLSVAKDYKDMFEISDENFDIILDFLNNESPHFKIEKFKFRDRVNGYIFCDEEGNVYTNSLEGEYIHLCSIFDYHVEEIISELKEFINPKTSNRYVSTQKKIYPKNGWKK
ncbi:radical SAM protein [Paenibacillus arenosi]|uniref:Radical SAM protein n=1 Tax=Paenibacillus arenosi TaxID=2774142 RepID=A0ABR9B195_9BACL|nr:radical SAM protein [Paenibacillus arenosi]MBD8500130.1 radical SAM protein [Paenibacillus arenosi]